MRVGMSRTSTIMLKFNLWSFHAGGNESYQRELFSERIRLVPHTWECIYITSGAKGYFSGCPTYVGMNRGVKLDKTAIVMRHPTWVGMNRVGF